ncbi:MAG: hypothetical protein ACLFSV_09510 [Alkalispirochaeta sp.]
MRRDARGLARVAAAARSPGDAGSRRASPPARGVPPQPRPAAPRPDGSGPAEAMREAMRLAQVNKEDIDYFNPHGTSTKLNDASEARALRNIYGEDTPPSSSTKSMVGHLLGAAGAVEAAATVLTLHHGVIPPTINYETPDPDCDLDYVPKTAREQKVTAAISNSFGFGGQNCSLLFTAS